MVVLAAGVLVTNEDILLDDCITVEVSSIKGVS